MVVLGRRGILFDPVIECTARNASFGDNRRYGISVIIALCECVLFVNRWFHN